MRGLKQPEEENVVLKKIVADLILDPESWRMSSAAYGAQRRERGRLRVRLRRRLGNMRALDTPLLLRWALGRPHHLTFSFGHRKVSTKLLLRPSEPSLSF